MVHPAAQEREVELTLAGNSNVSVHADKRALKQILINLLANAVKFSLPRRQGRAARHARTKAVSASPSAIPAWASLSTSCRAWASPSSRWRTSLPRGIRAPALGLRFRVRWPNCMAASSTSRASRAKAPPSPACCPLRSEREGTRARPFGRRYELNRCIARRRPEMPHSLDDPGSPV